MNIKNIFKKNKKVSYKKDDGLSVFKKTTAFDWAVLLIICVIGGAYAVYNGYVMWTAGSEAVVTEEDSELPTEEVLVDADAYTALTTFFKNRNNKYETLLKVENNVIENDIVEVPPITDSNDEDLSDNEQGAGIEVTSGDIISNVEKATTSTSSVDQ